MPPDNVRVVGKISDTGLKMMLDQLGVDMYEAHTMAILVTPPGNIELLLHRYDKEAPVTGSRFQDEVVLAEIEWEESKRGSEG